MNSHTFNNSKPGKKSNNAWSAVADKWKSNAGNRQDADINPDMDKNLGKKKSGESQNKKLCEIILWISPDLQNPQK